METFNSLKHLYITPITIVFTPTAPVNPGGELGDALRRMFETTFKRIDNDLEKRGRKNEPFFRGQLPEEKKEQAQILKDFSNPPRGYSLAVQLAEHGKLTVSINLFGRYSEVLPQLIPHIKGLPERWPKLGLRFDGLYDTNEKPIEHYHDIAQRHSVTIGFEILQRAKLTSNSLTLHFLSPTMLFNNHNSYGNMRFADLVRSLHRRAQLISHIYCNGPVPSDDFGTPAAEEVNIASSTLEWYFSTTKSKENTLKGYLGQVRYVAKPELLAQFLPLILMGQWLHVGQKTNYGAGQYMVDNSCYRY